MTEGIQIFADGIARCGWVDKDDPAAVRYHDDVWGVPTHDERDVFEALTLGVFELGMNWDLIFHKRAAFAKAFSDFHPEAVAAFDAADVERLDTDAAIVRNHRKIDATIANARLAIGTPSLATTVWVDPPVQTTAPTSWHDMEVFMPDAERLSTALRASGYRFIGPSSTFSLMQTIGVVNNHLAGCVRAIA